MSKRDAHATLFVNAFMNLTKQAMKESMLEMLPELIGQELDKRQEDELLNRSQASRAMGVTYKTGCKYLDAWELEGKLRPVDANGMKKYWKSELLTLNLKKTA